LFGAACGKIGVAVFITDDRREGCGRHAGGEIWRRWREHEGVGRGCVCVVLVNPIWA